ncbi:MAG: helix-turn-helix transcriptional regulator [Rickettsiales bacterium]
MPNKQAIEYQQSVSARMVEFCKPLNDYFGIAYFAYFKIYPKDSSYITFSNDAEYTQEYCTKIHNETMYFQQYIENNNEDKVILWPKDPFNLATDLIFKRGHWHGLNIVTQWNDNVMEGFDFVAHKDNFRINEFYIKHYDVLKKFIEQFKIIFADVITNAEICKAKYKNGFIHNLPEHQEVNISDIQAFLQDIGANSNSLNIDGQIVQLTKREMQCLELVDKGCSAKIIGRELLLSPKTIENHLNNIRQKTGVHHKHDLLKFYRQLF